jgi:hypothetical protein
LWNRRNDLWWVIVVIIETPRDKGRSKRRLTVHFGVVVWISFLGLFGFLTICDGFSTEPEWSWWEELKLELLEQRMRMKKIRSR